MEFVILQKKLRYLNLYISLIFSILILSNTNGQNGSIPDKFCISVAEDQLHNRINQFRIENGKTNIENSISLSYVAKLHVDDLLENHPDTSICNLSSWSDKGEWTACCYNSYVPNPDCMWDKPKEITSFKYRGYELALYFEDDFDVDTVMQLIQSSKEARDMILTNGNYGQKKWICGGIGINEHYVSIWFAQRPDREGNPIICKGEKELETVDSVKEQTSFYLIVASFESVKDAREALKRLKQNGYKDSGILRSESNIRLYINKFDGLKEAMYFKQNLPYTYNDSWIYKQ